MKKLMNMKKRKNSLSISLVESICNIGIELGLVYHLFLDKCETYVSYRGLAKFMGHNLIVRKIS